MATTTERLALIIDADARGAVRELKALGITADKELAKPQARLDRASGSLTKYGTAAVIAGGTVALGLKSAADATQDLADSKDKADAAFGSSAALEKYAGDAAKAMGKSKAAALDAASVYGNVGRAAGVGGAQLTKIATDLAVRTADIAEQQKKSYAEVESAIISGLNGRAKALKVLGVDLSEARLQETAYAEGIAATGSKLTAQQKYLAAYKLILDQTASAQGIFANSTDDLGVAQEQASAEFENAKAALGEAALPAFTAMANATSNLLGRFNDLPESVQTVVGSLVTLGAVGSIAGGSIATVAGQALRAAQWFRDGAAARAASAEIAQAAAAQEVAATRAITAASAESAIATTRDSQAKAALASATSAATAAQARHAAALQAAAATALSGGGASGRLSVAQAEVAVAASAAAQAEARLSSATAIAAGTSTRAAAAAEAEAVARGAAAKAADAQAAAVGRAGAAGGLAGAGGALAGAKVLGGKALVAAFVTDLTFGLVNGITNVEEESSAAMKRLSASLDADSNDVVRVFSDSAVQAEQEALKWSHLVTTITDADFKLGGVGGTQNVSDMKAAFDKLLALDPAAAQKLVDSVKEMNSELSANDSNRKQSADLVKVWQRQIDEATGGVKAQTDALEEGTGALDEFGNAVDKASGLDVVNDYLDLVDANERLADAQKSSADAARDQSEAIRGVASAQRGLESARRDLADKRRDADEVQRRLSKIDPETNPNLFREVQEEARDALDAVADAQDRVADASDTLVDRENDLADARGEGVLSAADVADAERDLTRARLDAFAAAKALEASIANGDRESAVSQIEDVQALVAAGLLDKATGDAIIGMLLRAIAAIDSRQAGASAPRLPFTYDPSPNRAGSDKAERDFAAIDMLPYGGPQPTKIGSPPRTGPGHKAGDREWANGRVWVFDGRGWAPVGGFATGGMVPGSGSGDTVPAMLTPGEFVIRKDAAKAIGPATLERLNRADSLPGFADGGFVGTSFDLSLPRADNGDVVNAIASLADRIATMEGSVTIQQYGDAGRFPSTNDTARAVRSGKYLVGR